MRGTWKHRITRAKLRIIVRMSSPAVRERLAQDVSAWLADGLISKHKHDLLRQRYGAESSGIGQIIKSLGIAGGMLAFFGLLGLVAAIAGSQIFGAFLLMAVGSGLLAAGLYLARDEMGRYPTSSKVVLMLGVVTATIGIGVALDAMGIKGRQDVVVTAGMAIIPVTLLAYRYRNTFLLILALIGFFHWVGTWNDMYGRSTYEFAVDDPRLMCLAALVAIVLGIYHEHAWREETGRFYQAYETFGLIYLNMSLLILSISHTDPQFWIMVWIGASIAQILAGARMHNPLLTGFGVTTFTINVYTRYWESCWRRFDTGVFFVLGGLSLFGAGLVCEIILRRWQRESQ